MGYALSGADVPRPRAGDMAVRAAASPAFADRVLALQQSAGNAAVTTLLRQPRRESAGARPQASIKTSVRRGGLGRFTSRTRNTVLRDDVIVVRARVKGVQNPSKDVGAILLHPPGLTVESQRWFGDTCVWEVRAASIGRFELKVSLVGAVTKELVHTIEVVRDADDQKTAILRALIKLENRFDRAAERLDRAGIAFSRAFGRQKDELAGVAAGERLDNELLWGVVFAGLGGFAGGAVGGLLKPKVMEALQRADAISRRPRLTEALREGFTDLGKDIVKFGVRTAGKPSAPTIGDSTAPPRSHHGHDGDDRDSRKPVLDDPHEFHLSLKVELSEEKVLIRDVLEVMVDRVQAEAGRRAGAVFGDDPLALVSKADALLDTITKQTNTDEDRYYEALWGAWVNAHYYSVEKRHLLAAPLDGDFGPYAVFGPGRRMTRLLHNVATACGYPSLEAFLNKHPPPDIDAKQKEADRKNECWLPWGKC